MIWLLLFVLLLLRGDGVGAQGLFTNIAVKPGPSAAVYSAQPYYTCNTNRYVSTTGNAGNNGLTPGTAWDMPTAAGTNVGAGTCINVAPGTYNFNTVGEIDMQFGGSNATKTGYVVWRCTTMPFSFSNGVLQGEGNGCVLFNNNTTGFIYLLRWRPNVNYIIWDGFEFNGNSPGNGSVIPTFGAVACVDAEADKTLAIPHHIWVLNSDIHGCGSSGLSFIALDWVFVIHNVWHDNSYQDCVMASGLSVFEPAGLASYTPTIGNTDYWHSTVTGFTYHYVFTYNVGYHNFDPQGACGATANTDGEGLILDTLDWASDVLPTNGSQAPYPYPMLVMGNIFYNNGGNGMEVFSMVAADPFGNGGTHGNSTGTVTFVNNTAYSNNWDTFNNGTFRAGVEISADQNIQTFNNVSYAVTQTGVNAACGCSNQPFLGQNGIVITTNSWQTNLSYPAGLNNFGGGNTYPTVGVNKNLDGSNPNFVNASISNPNFSLQGGSPAIGFGQAFDLWQSGGAVDVGACDSTLTACP